MVTVADLLKKKGAKVHSIAPDATIREALQLMAEKDVGALPVVEGKEIAGIFSERDFARLLAKGGAFPLDTAIKDVMTKDLITVSRKDQVTIVERGGDQAGREDHRFSPGLILPQPVAGQNGEPVRSAASGHAHEQEDRNEVSGDR